VRCPLGTEDCIRLITPEHVLNAVQRLLSGARLDADSEGTAFIPQFMTL
jgi:hypothetical protein